MMKQSLLLSLCFFIFSITLQAQDSIQVVENSLNNQMNNVFEKSNSYQEYKVIKKTQLATLKRNVLDSISHLQKTINDQRQELSSRQARVDSLNTNLKHTKEDLRISQEKEDGIHVLGVLTSKSKYNSVMWSIIGILLVICGFLLFRFLTSHRVINSAELKIAELEIEIEDYRRNALEREQKLRRKLQDEINKNRKLS